MDQETREMFGKVLSVLEIMKTDINILKTDVSELKADVSALKTDVSELKADVTELKTDVSELTARQDEMYLMLKGSEESRLRLKALEEKSSISALERDRLKMDSAKIVGALRRGAHEILNGLADEDVS